MRASKHGRPAFGAGKFWVAMGGAEPETYGYGPFDGREEAEEEARQMLAEEGLRVATIGRGEEVELYLPDADDIIERMTEGLYEQCGEVGADYLDSHSVSNDRKRELTEAVENVVAGWLTRHGLWPTFCHVEAVGEITRPIDRPKAGER